MVDEKISVHEYGYIHAVSLKNEVELEDCVPLDMAYPSNRCLTGTEDSWAAEEWYEPISLPDGSTGNAVYLFDTDTVNDVDPEDYPWDSAHCHRIILDPDQ